MVVNDITFGSESIKAKQLAFTLRFSPRSRHERFLVSFFASKKEKSVVNKVHGSIKTKLTIEAINSHHHGSNKTTL
ncbi:MAG: hypothetical protein V3S80_00060 [Sulfurimonadaceae bacterium]